MQGIYCIEHIESGRKYYGSSMNIEKRLAGHKRELMKNSHHNIQLQRAVNKYGIDAFIFYIVDETDCIDRSNLFLLEQTYIDQNTNGYNMAPANGGDIISNHPDRDAIVEKMRQTNIFRYQQMSAEERKSKFGNPGSKNGMYGKTHSPEVKEAQSQRAKGNTSLIGYKRTQEFKDKISAAMKGKLVGEKNPFYGKHHTEETKRRIGEANSGDNCWIKGIDPSLLPYTKYYIITYPTGETKEVAGLKVIAEEFNVSITNVHATIKRMAQGKLPSRSVFSGHFIKEVS